MGQVLHASATTTETVRRAIQHSQKPEGSRQAPRVEWLGLVDCRQTPSRGKATQLKGGSGSRSRGALLFQSRSVRFISRASGSHHISKMIF